MPSKWRQKELGTTRCGPPGSQRARSSSDDPRIRSELLPPGAASTKQPNDLHCTFTPLRTSHPQRRDGSPACPCATRVAGNASVKRGPDSEKQQHLWGPGWQKPVRISLFTARPPPRLQSPPSGGSLTAQGVWVCFCFFFCPLLNSELPAQGPQP